MSRETIQNAECPAESPGICARRHWSVYWLLIGLTFATVVGNILHVKNQATRGASPFFSANDRSRWCTIYSLVHFGTYEIDRVIQRKSSIHWDTIDKVQHIGADGQLHFYSSKPTLFPTLLAGQYWCIRYFLGWNLDEHPLRVARLMLVVTNAIPFMFLLVLLAALLERWFVSDWTRYFVVAAGGFGTFLTTFCVTLNNHLPAAVATMAAIYFVDRIVRSPDKHGWPSYFFAGLAAAFAVANELPALILSVLLAGVLMWRGKLGPTVSGFGLGNLVVATAFLATNWAAHGKWELAYGHRSDGPVIKEFSNDWQAELDRGTIPEILRAAADDWARRNGQLELGAPTVNRGTWMGQPASDGNRWVIRDQIGPTQFAIVQRPTNQFELREWNNWYDFPGSYWSAPGKRSAVDNGEESPALYAFHMIMGHHGVLSLTPLWILAAAGMLTLISDFRYQSQWLGWVSLLATTVVFVFYLTREPHDRNYGGQTSGLRWMFWLIPLWLVCLTPVVQWLASTSSRRAVCLFLLLISILSVRASAANPWTHPWLYQAWPFLENWIPLATP